MGVVGWDEGIELGTGTIFNFRGPNVTTTISGTVVDVYITGSIGGSTGAVSGDATYMLVGIPTALDGATGTNWKVPTSAYASGSLAYFYNGSIQIKGVQYEELIYPSGTFHTLFIPASDASHMVIYGVPMTAQSYSTGSGGGSIYDLVDSDGELLVDSDGVQLVDSDGS